MRSLSAHLRAGDQHDRLPFHAECPRCRRERSVGSVRVTGIVPLRAQAAAAAGTLVLTAAAPAASIAGEGRDEHPSGGVVGGAGDTAVDPDFDPGGESADLPVDVSTPPIVDEGMPEPEPAGGEVAPTVDPGDGADVGADSASGEAAPSPPSSDTESPSEPAAATTPTATYTGAESPPVPSSNSQPAPIPAPPVAPTEPHVVAQSAGPRARGATRGTVRTSPESRQQAPVVVADEVQDRAAHPAVAPAGAQPRPALRSTSDAPLGGEQAVHVVRDGESLWSIARDRLGSGASSAQVAREVNRLWKLNGDRIGTGNPDLLPAGTRLVLE